MIIDFIVLNLSYVVLCHWANLQDTPFYSKQVWFLLNLSFFIVVYVLGSLHDKRVVYIDRVLVHLVKYVMLHAVIFLMLVSFIDALPPWKAILYFYINFVTALSAWWFVARILIQWHRGRR